MGKLTLIEFGAWDDILVQGCAGQMFWFRPGTHLVRDPFHLAVRRQLSVFVRPKRSRVCLLPAAVGRGRHLYQLGRLRGGFVVTWMVDEFVAATRNSGFQRECDRHLLFILALSVDTDLAGVAG